MNIHTEGNRKSCASFLKKNKYIKYILSNAQLVLSSIKRWLYNNFCYTKNKYISPVGSNRSRPPFMLVRWQRKRFFWQKPEEYSDDAPFYIRPDSIRMYLWIQGIIFIITDSVAQNEINIISAILLFLSSIIIPQLVVGYRLRRMPVLERMWTTWPGKTGAMDKWLTGLPLFGIGGCYTERNKFINYLNELTSCLPVDICRVVFEKREMSSWLLSGSIQESFLRAGIVDHFVGLSNNPDKVSSTMKFRWAIDWLYSIWGGLFSIVLLIFLSRIYNKIATKESLTLLALAWFIMSTITLLMQSKNIIHWCCLSFNDIKTLPASVRTLIIEQHPEAVITIADKFYITIQTAAQGFILSCLISIVKNLF